MFGQVRDWLYRQRRRRVGVQIVQRTNWIVDLDGQIDYVTVLATIAPTQQHFDFAFEKIRDMRRRREALHSQLDRCEKQWISI